MMEESGKKRELRCSRRDGLPLLTMKIDTDIIRISKTFYNIDTNDMKRRLKLKRKRKQQQQQQHQEEEKKSPINRVLRSNRILPITNTRPPPTIQYHKKTKYFFTAADGTKTEIIPLSNGLKMFPFLDSSASSARVYGGSLFKPPRVDLGQSSETMIENLTLDDAIHLGTKAEAKGVESSETVFENPNPAAEDSSSTDAILMLDA